MNIGSFNDEVLRIENANAIVLSHVHVSHRIIQNSISVISIIFRSLLPPAKKAF